MRCLLLLFCLAACDDDAAGNPDLAPSGICPSATMCDPNDQCTYPGFEPSTCVCVSPENVACCSGGAGAACLEARQGAVCCGLALPSGYCANGCQCIRNHWSCRDGGV
jgi:hypothetical protein